MSDDLLSKMTSALADEHDGATAVPEATRSRVVRTLAERKPRRRKWIALGIPVFAIFGGSTAWAAATGNLPEIVERAVAVFVGEADESAPSEVTAQVSNRAPQQQPVEVDQPDSAAPEDEPEEAPEEPEVELTEAQAEPAPAPVRVAPTNQPKENPSPKVDAPQEDHTDLLAYRQAHRAHFQNGDCASAITGYRKYLRDQPSGTFALEAKYNLGVCLVRMGQNAEAKKLLTPFANGVYGDYRRDKAQELIDAL